MTGTFLINSNKYLIMIFSDQQTSGSTSRDMGSEGCVLVEGMFLLYHSSELNLFNGFICYHELGCEVNNHRNFEIKLFANPNGVCDNDNNYPIRMVLSSFYWQGNSFGVPDGLSDCSKCTINCSGCMTTTADSAYSAESCGYDSKSYTRAHRDIQVVNAMRSWMHMDPVSTSSLGLKC